MAYPDRGGGLVEKVDNRKLTIFVCLYDMVNILTISDALINQNHAKILKRKTAHTRLHFTQRKKLQHARTTAHIAAFETVLTLS